MTNNEMFLCPEIDLGCNEFGALGPFGCFPHQWEILKKNTVLPSRVGFFGAIDNKYT